MTDIGTTTPPGNMPAPLALPGLAPLIQPQPQPLPLPLPGMPAVQSPSAAVQPAPAPVPEGHIPIDLNHMRTKSLFIATPMYGGQCTGQYAKSLVQTVSRANELGIRMYVHMVFNESLIQRARNNCTQAFMNSDYTHLMFIDADIGWNPDDLLLMLYESNPGSGKDVSCGPYPKKTIAWEKIAQAVNQGAAEPDAQNLENYVGDYVFNVKFTGQNQDAQGRIQLSTTEPFEVMEGGTGFMLIQREILERFRTTFPHLVYRADQVRTAGFENGEMITEFFACLIEPQSQRLLSEDYYFCHKVQEMGGKIWMYPGVHLTHTGTYTFGGSLGHLASIGADATAAGYKENLIKKAEQGTKKVHQPKRPKNKNRRSNRR